MLDTRALERITSLAASVQDFHQRFGLTGSSTREELLSRIPIQDEEVRELHVPLSPTSSYYEARAPGPDGSGEISLRALVKLVLAMRPHVSKVTSPEGIPFRVVADVA